MSKSQFFHKTPNLIKLVSIVKIETKTGDTYRLWRLCLVLLCDQNSFGRSKMVLVWPNWFGLDHNDLVTTKMKWSWPKWIGQVQRWFILVENHNLDLTNSFWSWPFYFGRDQIIMVMSKSIWSDQNHFGPTITVLIT